MLRMTVPCHLNQGVEVCELLRYDKRCGKSKTMQAGNLEDVAVGTMLHHGSMMLQLVAMQNIASTALAQEPASMISLILVMRCNMASSTCEQCMVVTVTAFYFLQVVLPKG